MIRELDLHVTNRCNMSCKHCVFRSGGTERILVEMPLSTIASILEEFARLGGVGATVNLFGGEPLLRRDIFEIIEVALQVGLRVGLTTNARVPRRYLTRLEQYPLARVTVDLDGAKATHDWLRATGGHFNQAVGALRRFAAAGLFTSVNVVVIRRGINDVPGLLSFLGPMGVRAVSFYYVTPLGRGVEIPDENVSREEWLDLRARVERYLVEDSPRFDVYWEDAFPTSTMDRVRLPYRCEAGHETTAFIRCDGQVFGCALLENCGESLGTIGCESLEAILARRRERGYGPVVTCPAMQVTYDRLASAPSAAALRQIRPECPHNIQRLGG